MLTAILKMHRLGIVHRDLNPGNIFLHFADLPDDQSPQNAAKFNNKSPGKYNGYEQDFIKVSCITAIINVLFR